MRDDTSKLPIPASAKRVLKMKGPRGSAIPTKVDAFLKSQADIFNGGQVQGFKNKDVSVQMGEARRLIEDVI